MMVQRVTLTSVSASWRHFIVLSLVASLLLRRRRAGEKNVPVLMQFLHKVPPTLQAQQLQVGLVHRAGPVGHTVPQCGDELPVPLVALVPPASASLYCPGETHPPLLQPPFFI